jgi:hypothetical protein
MHEKKALTREVSKRYQKAGRKEKTRILDELVKTTGYNRKYALHLLANWGNLPRRSWAGRRSGLKPLPADLEGNGYVNVHYLRSQDSPEIFMPPVFGRIASYVGFSIFPIFIGIILIIKFVMAEALNRKIGKTKPKQ